jgi:hypothetical protein
MSSRSAARRTRSQVDFRRFQSCRESNSETYTSSTGQGRSYNSMNIHGKSVVSQCYSNKISWLRDSEGNPSGIVSVSS